MLLSGDDPRQVDSRLVYPHSSRERPLLAAALVIGKLSQDVGRITAPAVGQPAKLIGVTSLTRELDELANGILVTVNGPRSQL